MPHRRHFDDDLEDEDDDNMMRRPPKLRPSNRGIRQSLAATQLQQQRRRRRSSARFLRLSSVPDDEDTQNNTDGNLQELYQKAIRLNAENKINASNSWSLKLIENMDNLLLEQQQQEEEQPQSVNFTKASCTLDASVKIYSYRVDDVHLTSYKVLANLNRSDNNKDQTKRGETKDGEDDDDGDEHESNKTSKRSSTVNTIESHVANINLNKLDAAFDIDPLFSKMSKTFDEGGAKGLLLVNLGVGDKGCNIVFDSSCDDVEQQQQEVPQDGQRAEGMVDVSNLREKLLSLLDLDCEMDTLTAVESLPLVPQLAQLRAQYDDLAEQGFVSEGGKFSPIRRRNRQSQFYGVTEEEENEADKSIHQEALERSRLSLGRSFVTADASHVDDNNEYAADDFGGGYDDDDDDDIGFEQFIASDEARLSAISFDGSVMEHQADKGTTEFLDKLAESPSLWANTGDPYAYWNSGGAANLLRNNNNHWAGVSHWTKKTTRPTNTTKKTSTKKKTKTSKRSLVDFSIKPSHKLEDTLFPKLKNKKATTSSLQWSDATVTKRGRNEHTLPMDAGIGLEQLASLFLRPDTVLKGKELSSTTSGSGSKKQVGFAEGPWDNGSFQGGFDDGLDDDHDDGPGFDMVDSPAENDDFQVAELEGVRKVEKVQVGYATVAKKVDVKRLKKELWMELEEVLRQRSEAEEEQDSDDDEEEEKEDKTLSFQQTVRDMEDGKTQADVTLPFYFICILHLANEKGLRLESKGLEDFDIYDDCVATPAV